MTRKKKSDKKNSGMVMHDDGMWIRWLDRNDDSMYPFPGGEMRTKQEYPYAYSPFFKFGNRETMKGCETVYSDHMSQWNFEKNRTAIANNFEKNRGYFNQSHAAYQNYLSEYFGEQVELRAYAEGANISTGYQYMIFFFKTK